MHNAVKEAVALGLSSVQVFTKNQRQWKTPPLMSEDITLWREALMASGWDQVDRRVVSHGSYLVNLASPDPEARKKSIALHRDELERCEALGIGSCVLHPGAHLGTPRKPNEPNRLRGEPSDDEKLGLERIASALDELHAGLPGYRVVSCLETTTGSGTNLGYDFAHLARIRELVGDPERVGICLDTCHVVASGYDMSTRAKACAVINEFDDLCSLANLRVVHLNDSEGAMGSRRDRHAHVGEGCCGEECFASILLRRELKRIPMILETPKEGSCDGTAWDLANVARLEAIRNRADVPKCSARGLVLRSVVIFVATAIGVGVCLSSLVGCSIFAPKSATSTTVSASGSRGRVCEPTAAEQAWLAEAEGLRASGDGEAALALFQDLLAHNPLLPEAYVGVGDVRFSQGRYTDAEPNYKKAAKLDPSDFRAQYGHGRSLQMLGRAAESIGAYQRALVADPASPEVNLNMATAYLSLGDARAASKYAERAVELAPKNAAAHVNLGVAYERLGRPSDAIAQYQAASELMPPTPQLLTNLINAYVADHRYPEAVNTAVALTKLASGAETFERLGWAEFRAGNYESSSAAYRQAVVIDAKYWPAWNGIGVNALNRWLASDKVDSEAANEARRAFRTSMQANPDQPKLLKLYTTYGL